MPVSMVMVGLGMDVNTQQIVDYLAERGIDISLLSFHGFLHGESLFLAKQVQNVETPHTPLGRKVSASDLNRKASEYAVSTLWQSARESLAHSSGTYVPNQAKGWGGASAFRFFRLWKLGSLGYKPQDFA